MIIRRHPLREDTMTTTPGAVPDDRAGESAGAAPAAQPGTGSDPALAVRNLSKTFGSGDEAVRAVEDVNFAVEPGTVVGLLGPNGAGKTTTIKSILGLVVPDAGEVRVAGVDVRENAREAYHHVGAMLEGARNVYWKLTPRENMEFFAAVGDEDPAALRERHDALLDQLSLTEKADEPVNDLSQGQKQKVSLACALARDVDVAFLDEPTLGLDVESSVELRREIRRLADNEETTVVLSSHDMDVVEDVCDRVIVMNDGGVVADDSVANLVDVFRSHVYRVDLDGTLPGRARDRLRDRYDAREFERVAGGNPDGERFVVSLAEPARLYDLMDDLREAGLTVVGLDSLEADLESAFLELTDGAAGPDGARPAGETGESPAEGAAPADGGVSGRE
jgi:ABC-2 type transport system ATP-binding protein